MNLKHHNETLDEIERLIDGCQNFCEFAELVAEVCSAKADHVQTTWQDMLKAQIWNRRAADLLEQSDRIERSFE